MTSTMSFDYLYPPDPSSLLYKTLSSVFAGSIALVIRVDFPPLCFKGFQTFSMLMPVGPMGNVSSLYSWQWFFDLV